MTVQARTKGEETSETRFLGLLERMKETRTKTPDDHRSKCAACGI